VARVSHWNGFSSYHQHITGRPEVYRYYDYEQWQREKKKKPIADYLQTIELCIDPLPHMKDMDAEARQQQIKDAVREQEAQCAAVRRDKFLRGERSSDRVMGLTQVHKLNPRDRTENKPAKGPRPVCYTRHPQLETTYRKFLRNFLIQFRRASILYRLGFWEHAKFPRGSLRPPLIEVVG
jgi:hypothetical protein